MTTRRLSSFVSKSDIKRFSSKICPTYGNFTYPRMNGIFLIVLTEVVQGQRDCITSSRNLAIMKQLSSHLQS